MNKEKITKVFMTKVFIFSPLKRCKKKIPKIKNIFVYIFFKNIEKYKRILPQFLIDVIKLINKKKFSLNKFKYLKKNIIDSPFIDNESKKKLIKIFLLTQKCYSNLRKFVHICKFKKCRIYKNEYDLRCNLLEKYPKSQKILILHENAKYTFRLCDLLCCWKNALTHQEDQFHTIINLKNPYTNIPFKKHDLYNIYFKAKFSTIDIPFLITEHFKLEFNNDDFTIKFSIILKDIAIKNYIFYAEKNEMYDDLYDMCNKYYKMFYKPGEQHFKIKNKDRLKIISKMHPYLQLYYIGEYSINISKRRKCKKILKIAMKKFFIQNITLLKDFFDEKNNRVLTIPNSVEMNKFFKDFSYN